MQAHAGVGFAATGVGADLEPVRLEADGKRAAHFIGLDLGQTALPRHALVIEVDAEPGLDLAQQIEIVAGTGNGAPRRHVGPLKTQGNGFLGHRRNGDKQAQQKGADAGRAGRTNRPSPHVFPLS